MPPDARAAGTTEGETLERHFWFPHFWSRAFVAVARRPHLWATAVRQLFACAAPGWWRRPPFLPRPDTGYLRFRFETAYGRSGSPTVGEFVDYLEWCRDRLR